MSAEFPCFLAGRPVRTAEPLDVTNPYDGTVVGRTWLGGEAEFETAAASAVEAAPVMRGLAAYQRAAILRAASAELKARRDEIGRTLAGEAGKPIKDAIIEVDRASMTFEVAAEEARRLDGEMLPMDLAPHGAGRMAFVRRVPIGAQEVFAPLVGLFRFGSFDEALREVNRSNYGLQAGVFTADLEKSLRAWDTLEVCGVIVNDVPTWRIDHMPYGGVKDSGVGREGPRSTIQEMTEPRLLVVNRQIG